MTRLFLFQVSRVATATGHRLGDKPACLSYSAVLSQRPDHRLFSQVDWDRVEGGEYAIVDPVDSAAILYLTERDYITQVRVSMTQHHKPIVLATPRDKRPSEDNTSSTSNSDLKNSPPSSPERVPWDSRTFRHSIRSLLVSGLVKVRKVTKLAMGQEKIESLVVVTERNLQSLLMSWANNLYVRVVGLGSSSDTRKAVFTWSTTMLHIFRHSKAPYLVSYLKVSLFVINAYLAGTKLKSTESLGIRIRLSNGLPKVLPLTVRRAIRRRDLPLIRLWASLLYTYKAIDSSHREPSMAAIVQEFNPSSGYELVFTQFSLFLKLEFKKWLFGISGRPRGIHLNELVPHKLHTSVKSGPNHRSMFLSMPMDTLAWAFRGLGGDNPILRYLDVIGAFKIHRYLINYIQLLLSNFYFPDIWMNTLSDHEALEKCGLMCHDIDNHPSLLALLKEWTRRGGNRRRPESFLSLELGKLAALPEAAGKVRIIAICDIWTQTVLKPLHNTLFSILGCLPTDATFDQQAAVNSFADENHKEIFSYDLSAATDTIPYTLYGAMFEALISKAFSEAWLALLRDRSWLLPRWQKPKGKKMVSYRITHQGQTHIQYGRGQPMGAFSSWAALALLHHALVQFSAFRVGLFPFADYRVLGDDIVIAGKAVANSYREVCSNLGVVIGLPKSFTSCEGFFNFASQSVLGQANLSPFSLKDEISSTTALARFSIALRELNKGTFSLSDNNWFSRLARIVIPSMTMRSVEASRKRGEVHLAVQYLSSLVFGAVIGGIKPFDSLQGLGVGLLGSRLVKPSLLPFTVRLEDMVRDTRKDPHLLAEGISLVNHMVKREYDQLVKEGEHLLKRVNSLLPAPVVTAHPYAYRLWTFDELIAVCLHTIKFMPVKSMTMMGKIYMSKRTDVAYNARAVAYDLKIDLNTDEGKVQADTVLHGCGYLFADPGIATILGQLSGILPFKTANIPGFLWTKLVKAMGPIFLQQVTAKELIESKALVNPWDAYKRLNPILPPYAVDRSRCSRPKFPSTLTVLGNEYPLPEELHTPIVWDGVEETFQDFQRMLVPLSAIDAYKRRMPPEATSAEEVDTFFSTATTEIRRLRDQLATAWSPAFDSGRPDLVLSDSNLWDMILAGSMISELSSLKTGGVMPLESSSEQPVFARLAYHPQGLAGGENQTD